MTFSEKLWQSASVRSVLEGRSFIDSKRINIQSLKDAEAFMECYGYRWDDGHDRKEIEALRQEAMALIREELLLDSESIPDEIAQQQDVRQYMLSASERSDEPVPRWSCAMLRIMHTLAHSLSFFNDCYQKEIRDQIMNRFNPHLEYRNDRLFLGEIPLIGFECRPAKSKRSVAMKLLHKSENVAADIFDWIGLRFVTEFRLDVLQVIAYLRRYNMVSFANIKPSRSRNTLLDFAWIRNQYQSGQNYNHLRDQLQVMDYPTGEITRSDNPYSVSTYHSVQFTCRQRIRIQDPFRGKLNFFFPFEVQILDNHSFQLSRTGMASHAVYKKRQRRAIRRRVLAHLNQNPDPLED